MVTRRQVLRLGPVGAAAVVLSWATVAEATGGSAGPSRAAPARTATPGATPATGPTSSPTASVRRATTASPSATAAAQDSLAARYAAAAKALKAYQKSDRVSFAVAIGNGRTGQTFTYRGTSLYETASIVKVDVLSVLLLQAQDRDRALTSSQKALAKRMICLSDNNATTALWRQIGGYRALRKGNTRLGLVHTAPTAASWGLTRTSAADQVKLVGALVDAVKSPDELTTASARYALALMRGVTSSQDWGISAAARGKETVAIKNGWLPRSKDGNRWIINSVGQVSGPGTDLRIAVLSRGNSSMGAGIKLVERVAALTRAQLDW